MLKFNIFYSSKLPKATTVLQHKQNKAEKDYKSKFKASAKTAKQYFEKKITKDTKFPISLNMYEKYIEIIIYWYNRLTALGYICWLYDAISGITLNVNTPRENFISMDVDYVSKTIADKLKSLNRHIDEVHLMADKADYFTIMLRHYGKYHYFNLPKKVNGGTILEHMICHYAHWFTHLLDLFEHRDKANKRFPFADLANHDNDFVKEYSRRI